VINVETTAKSQHKKRLNVLAEKITQILIQFNIGLQFFSKINKWGTNPLGGASFPGFTEANS